MRQSCLLHGYGVGGVIQSSQLNGVPPESEPEELSTPLSVLDVPPSGEVVLEVPEVPEVLVVPAPVSDSADDGGSE